MAETWSYVAADASEEVATRLIAGIVGRLEGMRQFPLAGVARPQLGEGVRAVFHDNYAIYDLSSPAETLILRILHGSRDIGMIGDQGGFPP